MLASHQFFFFVLLLWGFNNICPARFFFLDDITGFEITYLLEVNL